MPGYRVVRTLATVLDSTGAGEVSFYPPGVDWATQLITRSVTYERFVPPPTHPPEPIGNDYLNGAFVEGSYTASKDSTDTRTVLHPNDQYRMTWTGGYPGATATATITAIQYPAGTAPAE